MLHLPIISSTDSHMVMPAVEGDEQKNATVQCLQLLKNARNRSAGKQNFKQQELERGGSDKVQRAKRLAKKGSRNELGELIQEPHKVLSLMIIKRDRATDEKEVALLKIVILGSPAELEDPSSEVCVFRPQVDQSRYTVSNYLQTRYLRETDVNCKLNDSGLSGLIWDSMDSSSSVVLLTCVSPAVGDFEQTVTDLRYACKARKERPTTAARQRRPVPSSP